MADRLRRRLDGLDAANSLEPLGLPGFRLPPRPETGTRSGGATYSIKTSKSKRS